MNLIFGPALSAQTLSLIQARHNVSPRRLGAPGPSTQALQAIVDAASAAPDHGLLRPWRFVIVPQAKREKLAEIFALALKDRDPDATAEQLESAREKAFRAPFLMLAIARLTNRDSALPAAIGRGAQHPESTQGDISDTERLLSLRCAIQNMLLVAQAAGFGTGLTSGQAMASSRLRDLFQLTANEQAVCWINMGTVMKHKPHRLRSASSDYVSQLS